MAARAADGTVEAIEGPGFALGVQWHAETLADGRLFEALVGASAPAPAHRRIRGLSPHVRLTPRIRTSACAILVGRGFQRRHPLRGVVKRFGPITAVNGLDLDVPEGTCVGLLGPNGAGKSTTMKLLTAQAIADEGSIGSSATSSRATRRSRVRRWASCRSSTTSTRR